MESSLLLGSAFVLAPVSAFAQAAPAAEEGPADGAEIVVTAQKRAERLSDVPISMTVATGEQLANAGVTAPDDLGKLVPGFVARPARTGVPVYSIRGIGFDDFGIGSAPAVSVSVDQIPLPFLIMTPAATLDIERVEVLKGPQGTLFGQNTTGGAIDFVAAKPTDTRAMGFALTYGRFNEVNANAFVSGPLSETLRFRIAASHEYRGPWQVSETRPTDKLGRRDFTAGRLLLDWTPTPDLSLSLNINGWLDRSEAPAAQFIKYAPTVLPDDPRILGLIGNRVTAPERPRIADWTTGLDYARDNKQYQAALRAIWDVSDDLAITSLTSYAKLNSDTPGDSSGSNFGLFNRQQIGRIESFFQEVRAAVDVTGARFIVGVNYQNDKTDDIFNISYDASNNTIGPFTWTIFGESANQRVKTYAAFASADVPITSTLKLQAGIRYTDQTRDFDGCLFDGGDGQLAGAIALLASVFGGANDPAPPGGCVTLQLGSFARLPTVTDTLKENNISWRVGADWKPTPDTLFYANVTRGYKAGAYSPVPGIFANQFEPVTQEKVTAYEIGLKTALLDRKIDVAAALFYNDYEDKQLLGNAIFPPFGSLPVLQNVPKAVSKGGELALTLRPLQGLTLTSGATYVRTRVTDSFIVSNPLGPTSANPTIDIKGLPFPNTPRWQGNVLANYEFAISDDLDLSLGGDIAFRSSTSSDFANDTVFRMRAHTLIGVRAALGTHDGRWQLELWGRNITNEFYETSAYKVSEAAVRTVGMPATYGVTFKTRFQ